MNMKLLLVAILIVSILLVPSLSFAENESSDTAYGKPVLMANSFFNFIDNIIKKAGRLFNFSRGVETYNNDAGGKVNVGSKEVRELPIDEGVLDVPFGVDEGLNDNVDSQEAINEEDEVVSTLDTINDEFIPALTVTPVLTSVATSSPSSAPSATEMPTLKLVSDIQGLVGYWKFDADTGTTIFDSSSNNNTGEIFNIDEDLAWIDGKIEKALRLDGNNDYVVINDLPELELGKERQSYTISLWIMRDGNPKFEAGIISKDDGYGKYPFAVTILPTGEVTFSVSDDTIVSKTVSGIVTDNRWHHVVAVRDDADKKLRVYLDGRKTVDPGDDETIGDLRNDDRILIGRYILYRDDASYFNDAIMIDDLRIYNRALFEDEVELLYKNSDTEVSFLNIKKLLQSFISFIFDF
jgi:hypothetical protein